MKRVTGWRSAGCVIFVPVMRDVVMGAGVFENYAVPKLRPNRPRIVRGTVRTLQ